MERDDGLAGAGAAGDLGDAARGGPDRLVLVALDGGDDVAHLAAAAAGERRDQRAVAEHHDVVGSLGHHQVVLGADHGGALAAQHPAAQHAHRVDRGGPVEGGCRRRAPVDDERLVVVVAHPEPADVAHLALLGGGVLVTEVEPAEDQALVLLVDHRAAPGGGVDQRVALEEAGHLLVTHVAGAAGAAARHPVGLDVGGAAAGLLELGVDPVDVGLLQRQLTGDVGGGLGQTRAGGGHGAGLLGAAAEVTELSSLIPRAKRFSTIPNPGRVASDSSGGHPVPRSTNWSQQGRPTVSPGVPPVTNWSIPGRMPGARRHADAGMPVPLARARH